MQGKVLSVFVAGVIICCYNIDLHASYYQQSNTAPNVVITRPASKEKFNWNSIIRYNISVADKEDGTSEYNEITPHEVILKTTYLPDSSEARAYMNDEAKSGAEPT